MGDTQHLVSDSSSPFQLMLQPGSNTLALWSDAAPSEGETVTVSLDGIVLASNSGSRTPQVTALLPHGLTVLAFSLHSSVPRYEMQPPCLAHGIKVPSKWHLTAGLPDECHCHRILGAIRRCQHVLPIGQRQNLQEKLFECS